MNKQFKDARHVAFGRFEDTALAKWCTWIVGGLLVAAALVAVGTILISLNNKPKIDPYPIYVIQSKFIEPEKDITLMYDNGWYVVNGHTLVRTPEAEMIYKTYVDHSQDYWRIPMFIIAGLFFCGSVVAVVVYECKRTRYYEGFMQKWSETKEYPDL